MYCVSNLIFLKNNNDTSSVFISCQSSGKEKSDFLICGRFFFFFFTSIAVTGSSLKTKIQSVLFHGSD